MRTKIQAKFVEHKDFELTRGNWKDMIEETLYSDLFTKVMSLTKGKEYNLRNIAMTSRKLPCLSEQAGSLYFTEYTLTAYLEILGEH